MTNVETYYMHMRRIQIALVVAAATLITGCATPPPPLSFSVPNVGYSTKKIEAEVKSITVSVAREDERKGDLPLGIEAIPAMWKSSLEEALNRMAIFKDDAQRKLSISVKVLAMNIPSFGAEMVTKTIARYEIIDRSNGDIVYTQDIAADGVVPFNHAFVGATRARESINRAVQNNITQFLQALETVDINKPMFPATAKK